MMSVICVLFACFTQNVSLSGGESGPTDKCPPGYYCPTGTQFWSQYGCPNGTYNPIYGMYEVGQCANCTQGELCTGWPACVSSEAESVNS